MDHKAATLYGDMKEEYFASCYGPFYAIELGSIADHQPEMPLFEQIFPSESPAEARQAREFYVCLTCRLIFKSRSSAADHKADSRYKVVRENYPIGPPCPAGFEKTSKVSGSNIDYDAFFQRIIDDVPNEN